MSNVVELIPDALAAEAEAARDWFVREQSIEFKLTGIVDPGDVLARTSETGARELQLILCGTRDGQEVCLRERFEVKSGSNGFAVIHLEDVGPGSGRNPEIGSPAPLLDPPLGVRAGWLDAVLEKHAFVVLVFYRGFW
jgi:hypothetical protein